MLHGHNDSQVHLLVEQSVANRASGLDGLTQSHPLIEIVRPEEKNTACAVGRRFIS